MTSERDAYKKVFRVSLVAREMTLALSLLLEESVQIAWNYLQRSGEIEDPWEANKFLNDVVVAMIRRGTTSRLLLSNRAIAAYQKRNAGLDQQSSLKIREWRPRSS